MKMNSTNTRIVIAVIAVVLLAGLAGCIGGDGQPDPEQNTEATGESVVVNGEIPHDEGVVRFTDYDAGVVCYAFAQDMGYDGQGGLSCVPIEDTNFGEGD